MARRLWGDLGGGDGALYWADSVGDYGGGVAVTRTNGIGVGLGVAVAGAIVVAATSGSRTTYDRDRFGGWTDQDFDCKNTRAEVLIASSAVPVTFDATGCRVVLGLWLDPYTGDTVSDASVLDIDHIVPLREAWRSGAAQGPAAGRRLFANDVRNLSPTGRSANRSKGARDPAAWMPGRDVCGYLDRWRGIKHAYQLTADPAEVNAIVNASKGCECYN